MHVLVYFKGSQDYVCVDDSMLMDKVHLLPFGFMHLLMETL
jgi:hypothetical protein